MIDVNGHAYQHLEPRPGSNYRQLFVKGRRIFAQTLYRATVGLEPRTAEQVAADFGVPLEAVLESIHYCTNNEPLLRAERERELERIRETGRDKPPYVPVERGSDE
jgi:uncharacterized protein (DUF433 family)